MRDGESYSSAPREERTVKIDAARFVDAPSEMPDGFRAREGMIEALPIEKAPIEFAMTVANSKSLETLEVRGLPEQTVMNNAIIVRGNLLGRGAFGEVYSANAKIVDATLRRLLWSAAIKKPLKYEPNGGRYVLKVIPGKPMDPEIRDERWNTIIENELVGSDVAGVLVSAKVFESPKQDRVYALLIDRAPGETLSKTKEIADDSEKRSVLYQIKLAIAMRSIAANLSGFHKRGWTHRDINPGNLMVDMEVPVLSRPIDFGIAEGGGLDRDMNADKKGGIGTISYMTPEALSEEDERKNERDIYALGLSFGEALGLMRPSKKNADGSYMILGQIALATSSGKFIESGIPDEYVRGVDTLSKYARPSGARQSKAGKEFFRLIYDIVRPHDCTEDRQFKWAKWNNGKGISMDAVAKRLDEIISLFSEELGKHEEFLIMPSKIEEMENEVREEAEKKKAEAFARWRILQRENPGGQYEAELSEAMDALLDARDDISRAVMADNALEILDKAEKISREEIQKKRVA